uniref:Uncharacterized protein n=1 Tax=Kalanchoe fedtschenkoi TaxID=63787 RepID=A0A7N0RH81_KALFE
MAEKMKKSEIEEVKDDASRIDLANIAGSVIGQLKTLEEIFRKFKKSEASTSTTNLSTDDYFEIPDDKNWRDEFAYDKIRNKVAKETSKVSVFIPFISSWINFLIDIIYTVVEHSANRTFLLLLSIILVVISIVSVTVVSLQLIRSLSRPSPKRQMARDLILDRDPGFERRSKALNIASLIAAIMVFVFSLFRVLKVLKMPMFGVPVVLYITIALIQIGVTTIKAMENFENPRLVCLWDKKVEELEEVKGLEPQVYYCNCANCRGVQDSSENIQIEE